MADAEIIPQADPLVAILDRLPDSLLERALVAALAADVVNRDGSTGPDHRVRLQALQFVFDRKLGKPVERQQILTANVGPTDSDLIERLAHSPALRAAIREAVEAAEKTSV